MGESIQKNIKKFESLVVHISTEHNYINLKNINII